MKFDTPATNNPIDQLRAIGHATDRIDGPMKTSGTAPYAYERHDAVARPAYGVVVGAAIAKGRIESMDLRAAQGSPGVITMRNAPVSDGPSSSAWTTIWVAPGPGSST